MSLAPVVCMITDRRRFGASWEAPLLEQVERAVRQGVHLVQIRERDLDARPLTALVDRCMQCVRGTHTRIVVNDRLDVALAAGAHGVHLRSDSPPAARVRELVPRPFLVGRSIHEADDAAAISADGALDYLIFGTVFPTSSKPGRPAAGLDALARACRATALPVLAVGGITVDRIDDVVGAGAAGIAGISLFSAV